MGGFGLLGDIFGLLGNFLGDLGEGFPSFLPSWCCLGWDSCWGGLSSSCWGSELSCMLVFFLASRLVGFGCEGVQLPVLPGLGCLLQVLSPHFGWEGVAIQLQQLHLHQTGGGEVVVPVLHQQLHPHQGGGGVVGLKSRFQLQLHLHHVGGDEGVVLLLPLYHHSRQIC